MWFMAGEQVQPEQGLSINSQAVFSRCFVIEKQAVWPERPGATGRLATGKTGRPAK